MRKKNDFKYVVLIVIIIGSIAYFISPVHNYNIDIAKTWWQGWYINAQTNLFPNERGLNVAVLDADGNFIESDSFDTYLYSYSGFPNFINSLPEKSWVIVSAMGEAATNLSEEDITTLKKLGGSDRLAGKFNWAYILVGYVGLGEGNGLEILDEKYLHINLEEDTVIGGVPLPIKMNIYSMGFYSNIESYAFINIGDISFKNLEYWIDVVKKRI